MGRSRCRAASMRARTNPPASSSKVRDRSRNRNTSSNWSTTTRRLPSGEAGKADGLDQPEGAAGRTAGDGRQHPGGLNRPVPTSACARAPIRSPRDSGWRPSSRCGSRP
jgi:hypothetical protein